LSFSGFALVSQPKPGPLHQRAKQKEISRMKQVSLLVLAVASLVTTLRAGEFADAVVSYEPGTGTSPRFQHPAAALGAPSQVNPFGESTDPFDPPYGTNQIVSIGAGGSLVLRFHTPLLNHPNNAYGYDFIIFGNTGFIITNEFSLETFNWIGTPATDGSLFAANPGDTRVSVSRDGATFYALNSAIAPLADGPFPPDGAGDPHLPTMPGLTTADFAGATLDDLRTLYQGSAGGTPYDISWAVDAAGRIVRLPEINFIRIDVLSGKSEIDAVSAVTRKARLDGKRIK
jgi:hypothetical protein